MSISTQPPIAFSKPAAEPERASISVVIPTLNEAKNVPWILRRMPLYVDEVVIVDGRSRDNTVGAARALLRDIVVVDEQRKGKDVALRSGFVLGAMAHECLLWEAPTAGARPEALRRVKYAYANVSFPRTPTDPKSVLPVMSVA